MRPVRLRMQAFGSYGRETTIDFEVPQQNLFLISGDTGAGKSTIFDAIVFALYGQASSNANKKEGLLLQSQFSQEEPFVELTFLEENRPYTVRRSPRYLRAKRGGGMREIPGSVTLYLPDGSEYPQKEADKKLAEIVGLTKEQFMQVAMIAQGEFMELLRAKSDDKKVIFRKLFGTELYERITEELNNRRREKERDLSGIKTQCQTVLARVILPEEETLLAEQKKQILDGNLSVLAPFLEGMELLITQLNEEQMQAREAWQQQSQKRDQVRDALTRASQLRQQYEQLEKAVAVLKECEEEEPAMHRAQETIRRIRAAYLVKGVHARLLDAQKAVDEQRTALEEQMQKLPAVLQQAETASEEEAKAKTAYDQELKTSSRIAEKAHKAMERFEKVEEARKRILEQEESLKKAKVKVQTCKEAISHLEAEITEGRKEAESLSQAEPQLARWEMRQKELQMLQQEEQTLRRLEKEWRQQKKDSDQASEAYSQAKDRYQAVRLDYEDLRGRFLDAQAGILARSLQPGMPCPVCGSLHHPAPCISEDSEISQEELKQLEKDVDLLRLAQEQQAAKAHSALEVCKEKENTFLETKETLKSHLLTYLAVGEVGEDLAREIDHLVLQEQKEGMQLQKAAARFRQLEEQLTKADQKRGTLSEQLEQAQSEEHLAVTEQEKARAAMASLEQEKEFASRSEAEQAIQEADQRCSQAKATHQTARKILEQARSRQDQTEALIEQYKSQIPVSEEILEKRRLEYLQQMENQKVTETTWKETISQYSPEEAEHLQKKVDQHQRTKASAEALQASAKEAIRDQDKPDLESLNQLLADAENTLQQAEEKMNRARSICVTDNEVFMELSSRRAFREKTIAEHNRLDRLYKLASGNISGSRMDLETYVQRYYLEQILDAANQRFEEMSEGQFELRMVDEERAGEGKNRGLDLMVYSTVTGKEREIRTLSGGESFMAALSLALGMADQIQENSAAIHLDIMFIDEGFGSLDDHSRDQAVRVLKEMAEGSRLIGIISHVSELKTQIEDQLVVRKDETGSHIHWEIG